MTGLIFAVIAAFWLMYLIPYFLHHRNVETAEDDADAAIPFTPDVTIVRSGTSLAEADLGTVPVSTPLTRRAQLRELRLLDERAAQRRRRVLVFLLVVQLIVAGLVVLGVGAWWSALIPAGLILAFLVVARFSVRTLRAGLAERARKIRDCGDEETVAIVLTADQAAEHEHSVELSVPIGKVGSLWDPIPITRPTYVSTPLAPRTVRTIDLSFPVTTPARMPVTADPISPAAATEPESQENVG